MIELSQEEKDRIYLEEKARKEARLKLQRESQIQWGWGQPIRLKGILQAFLVIAAGAFVLLLWMALKYGK